MCSRTDPDLGSTGMWWDGRRKNAAPLGGPLARKGGALLLFLIAFLPSASAQVILSEVLYDTEGVDAGRQVVELTNTGAEVAPVGGFWLYLKPASWQLPAAAAIPPGGTVVIHINSSGQNTAAELFTGSAGMRNLRHDDSVSLFSQNVFTDASKLVDFVEWGSPGQAGEDVAVEAGKWLASDSVSVALLREGSSIAFRGGGHSAAAWCVDGTPSLGLPNDGCARSFPKSPVRLNEVRPGPRSMVELKNVGRGLEDLEGKFLLSKSSGYRFPAGSLLIPGQIVVVHLGVAGTSTETDYYTGPGFGDLAVADSLAFLAGPAGTDPTLFIDYLEWGQPGQPFEAAAVEAGLWQAGSAIDTAGLASGGAVAAGSETPASWSTDNTPTLGSENGDAPPQRVVLNEVLLSPPAGEAQAVELQNRTDAPVDLAGFTVCSHGAKDAGEAVCRTLPPGIVLPPNGLLVIRLAAGAGSTELPLALPALDPEGGELALLVASPLSTPGNMVDYLRWGAGSTAIEPLASSAGIWGVGESVDVNGLTSPGSIAAIGTVRGPANFRLDSSPSLGAQNEEPPPAHPFVRADCNQDGALDLSDPISVFSMLFFGGEHPDCDDACDANDDGSLDISDPVYILGSLFLGGAPPKPPRSCGADPSQDPLTCAEFRGCSG